MGKGSCRNEQWQVSGPVHLGMEVLRASLDGEVRLGVEGHLSQAELFV